MSGKTLEWLQNFLEWMMKEDSLCFMSILTNILLIWLNLFLAKVDNISKCSLDSIPSPLPSVRIQIMGGKVFLRCKSKTLLGIVNKHLKTKCLLNITKQYFASLPEVKFPPIIWIFTEGEGDRIKSGLSS